MSLGDFELGHDLGAKNISYKVIQGHLNVPNLLIGLNSGLNSHLNFLNHPTKKSNDSFPQFTPYYMGHINRQYGPYFIAYINTEVFIALWVFIGFMSSSSLPVDNRYFRS